MIEPYKPLIDSGLAAFLIFDSNKSAPIQHQKPPRSSLTVAAPLINNPKTFTLTTIQNILIVKPAPTYGSKTLDLNP